MILRRIMEAFGCRKKSLWQIAEDRAADFLRGNAKLKIIARNWRSGRYETDIVAYDRKTDTIVFVEVKCRQINAKVPGFYAATGRHKAECLKKCARSFIAKERTGNKNRRFDVVEVNHDGNGSIIEINHFENVRL